MNIILIGPQGCGKGTQAEKIVANYGLYHLETGALIRAQASGPSPKAVIINHLVNNKGQLLPDGVVLDLIADGLEQHHYDGILFDGFPRTLAQYEVLTEFFAEQHTRIDAGIYLSITDDMALDRLSGRRTCSVCHRPYNQKLDPDRQQCDCGGELVTRPDDQPEAIQSRLAIFHSATQPILERLKQEDLLVEIDGSGNVEEVFTKVQAALTAKQLQPA